MTFVYVLEVNEFNTYSYDGTVSVLKGIFTSEDDAHKAGKELVKLGYNSYSVDTWLLNKVY